MLEWKAAISGIARRTGGELVDSTIGHARWDVYRRAMESPAEWVPLLEIIYAEPDPAIATSVVLGMLERVPAAERSSWVERIGMVNGHALAIQRRHDIEILDTVTGDRGTTYTTSRDEFSGWSDWLQRRASEEATSLVLLEQLSEAGRTRRVRNDSGQRLRKLRRAP